MIGQQSRTPGKLPKQWFAEPDDRKVNTDARSGRRVARAAEFAAFQ
jgi:hypothetical protein